jgi:hypothetical protein
MRHISGRKKIIGLVKNTVTLEDTTVDHKPQSKSKKSTKRGRNVKKPNYGHGNRKSSISRSKTPPRIRSKTKKLRKSSSSNSRLVHLTTIEDKNTEKKPINSVIKTARNTSKFDSELSSKPLKPIIAKIEKKKTDYSDVPIKSNRKKPGKNFIKMNMQLKKKRATNPVSRRGMTNSKSSRSFTSRSRTKSKKISNVRSKIDSNLSKSRSRKSMHNQRSKSPSNVSNSTRTTRSFKTISKISKTTQQFEKKAPKNSKFNPIQPEEIEEIVQVGDRYMVRKVIYQPIEINESLDIQ